jgi:hypothetical protein
LVPREADLEFTIRHPTTTQIDTPTQEVAHLNETIAVKKRRLQLLELQQAHYDMQTEPATLMEIEDLKNEIGSLEKRSRELQLRTVSGE